jgi:hypothetical protein
MFGVCTSIGITSNSPSFAVATASAPSLATVTVCPCFCGRRTASFFENTAHSLNESRPKLRVLLAEDNAINQNN